MDNNQNKNEEEQINNEDDNQWQDVDAEDQLQNEEIKQQNQEDTLGCQHYLRNCQIEAPCCKIFYPCKICHDERYGGPKSKGCKMQRMQFQKVSALKCLKCGKVQQVSPKCVNPQCQSVFGKYACLKCKLYENRSSKVNDIFHCDKCKMCRRGKMQNFFHCDNCGYCRSITEKNNHWCNENLADSQCPICLQILKFSTKHYYALACGHLIHVQCERMSNSINCPVCGMAKMKLPKSENQRIQSLINQTKDNLPKQLKDKKVDILCNQCLHKSCNVSFHFFGMKCEACGTYNTKQI